QDVLPDRVAGAAVEQRDILRNSLRRQRPQPLLVTVLEDAARPPSRDRCIAAELLEVEPAGHGEVVVSAKAHGCMFPDERAALVRPGAVADEVSETPQLVDGIGIDCREHGLERVEVAVDIRHDRDPHAYSLPARSPASVGTVAGTVVV